MGKEQILLVILLLFLMLCNQKVCLFQLFKEQIHVFRNNKTNKISIWDLFCFIIMPIILGCYIVFCLDKGIDNTIANMFITIYALIFTILFGFISILISKINNENKVKKRVVKEAFISIMTTNILSLLIVILSFVVYNSSEIYNVLSIFIYSFVFMTIMLLLMISKRIFVIYINENSNKK